MVEHLQRFDITGMQRMNKSIHMIIRVARDCDLFEQIGRDIYFDLVDHDKVRAFRILKTCPFSQFKEDIAEDFGISVQFLRFWKWAERQNHTHRLDKPLMPEDESKPVGKLIGIAGGMESELKLFLEVGSQDGSPVSPQVKTNEDIMLFFKLYDPEKGTLRYVGRLFVKSYAKPSDTLGIIKEMGGISRDEEVDLYEEIEFKPSIKCKLIDKALPFQDNKIEDGNIICFQKTLGKRAESCRYPTVPSFLEHIGARREMEVQSYPSQRFVWKISNFSKLTSEKYYSEVFTIAGCKWEVIIFPKGGLIPYHLSIYLRVADAAFLPTGWSRSVDFSLIVVDQYKGDSSIKMEKSREFNALKTSWGFPSFMPLTKLHDKTKGYLAKDTLVVEANVVVLKVVPPVIFASKSARETTKFLSFFESLSGLFDTAEASTGVERPRSGTQTSDAASTCLSLKEVECAKQFLKECLRDHFKLSMKERLASALSTLSVAQTGLSREQKKSVLEFWGHFDEFLSDYLILEQENSQCESLKVQKDQVVSSMTKNRGRHLLYKELSEKLAREEEELQKMLEETRFRNAKLMLDWGALIAKTEEAKSNYVSLEQKLAGAEVLKRIAEERTSRSTTAWWSLKAHFL